jgi:hypothetical protein
LEYGAHCEQHKLIYNLYKPELKQKLGKRQNMKEESEIFEKSRHRFGTPNSRLNRVGCFIQFNQNIPNLLILPLSPWLLLL